MAQPPGTRRQARASTQYQRQPQNFTASSSSLAGASAGPLGNSPAHPLAEGKVAIPRLLGAVQQPPAPDRNRVNHACEPCRKRKSKCDGVHPICSRCKNQGVDCMYADGKRERLKRQVFFLFPLSLFEAPSPAVCYALTGKLSLYLSKEKFRNAQTMAMKISVYEKLLTNLMPSQSPDIQQNSSLAEEDVSMSDENSPPADQTIEDENSVVSAVASPLRGYSGRRKPVECLGDASTVRWLGALLAKLHSPNFISEAHIMSLASYEFSWKFETSLKIDEVNEKCTYFSGEVELPQLAIMDDVTMLPPKDVADLLVNAYFTTIHPLFPVLPKVRFLSRYNSYYHNRSDPLTVYPWLAILNMVLALGSLWARYTHVPTGEVEDHGLYCARSQALAQGIVDPRTYPGTYPSIEPIQLIAIRGMYQLATYQVAGAWASVTTGLKFAYTRALSLANSGLEPSNETKQLEARVWHSLQSLEQFLCLLAGFPSELQGQLIHASQPQAGQPPLASGPPLADFDIPSVASELEMSAVYTFDEEFPSSTFIAGLRLDELVGETLASLYGIQSLNYTWAHTQRLIADLDSKLNRWQGALDPGFPYPLHPVDICCPPSVSVTYLYLRYNSARILINRPALCDPSELMLTIPYQSEASRQMDLEAATRCVSAARQILQILPSNMDLVELHGKTPWWCIVHYIVQASCILIMEISLDEPHLPLEIDDLISSSERAIRWLSILAGTCDSANNAYICISNLHHLALAKRERASQEQL
ncbi:uncharacterized protein GIQ15_04019 [Arthroderma uncinatum]|uniref:uncharacterized protein n=1 Tax=Arthroderma uncinatum TaxID=74035 RepID=UPI00144AB765|nr:uncharacterized protein GIQ15_04019 [Arthroderma uncinatum]KAF3481260.1 hypothetical protein GIQ15_04019 [Arthroderma uncinatum]